MGLINALCAALVLAAWAGTPTAAHAEEMQGVAPVATIFPGDVIRQSMVRRQAVEGTDGEFATMDDVLGRAASRTLLAGRPIARNAIEDPKAVTNGAAVRLVYAQPGLTIIATGQALQAGRVGDVIRIRNTDSGNIVSGVIAADGSVRVGQ